MRNKTAEEIEDIVIDGLKNILQDKMEKIHVVESSDDPYPVVAIEFLAYKYFGVRFSYDRGSIGCSILNGELGIGLESSEKWFDEADLDKFFNDIKDEIEIRIPDKFLKKKGWL